jgi:hypothetical protein
MRPAPLAVSCRVFHRARRVWPYTHEWSRLAHRSVHPPPHDPGCRRRRAFVPCPAASLDHELISDRPCVPPHDLAESDNEACRIGGGPPQSAERADATHPADWGILPDAQQSRLRAEWSACCRPDEEHGAKCMPQLCVARRSFDGGICTTNSVSTCVPLFRAGMLPIFAVPVGAHLPRESPPPVARGVCLAMPAFAAWRGGICTARCKSFANLPLVDRPASYPPTIEAARRREKVACRGQMIVRLGRRPARMHAYRHDRRCTHAACMCIGMTVGARTRHSCASA